MEERERESHTDQDRREKAACRHEHYSAYATLTQTMIKDYTGYLSTLNIIAHGNSYQKAIATWQLTAVQSIRQSSSDPVPFFGKILQQTVCVNIELKTS